MGLLGKAMAFRAGKAIFDQATRKRRGAATRRASGNGRGGTARAGTRPAARSMGGGGLAGIARRLLRG